MNSVRIKGNMSLKMRFKPRASSGSQSSSVLFRFFPYFANEVDPAQKSSYKAVTG